MATITWKLENKGSTTVSLRKTKSYHSESFLDKPGKYTLILFTKDKVGVVSVRMVEIKLTLIFNGDVDDPVIVKKKVHNKRMEEKYSFFLEPNQTCTWTIDAKTPAVIKPITFGAHLEYREGSLFEEKEEEINEKNAVKELSEKHKAKLEEAMSSWPCPKDYNELTYPQERAIVEMSRNSEWKRRALELGVIRPFLLLVSMDPQTRLQWAQTLGIDIISKNYYGDSHQEAWKMLVRKQKGIQPRAGHAFAETARPLNPNPVWYQILHRVCRKAISDESDSKDSLSAARKTYKSALAACLEARNEEIFHLEEIFSNLIRATVIESLKGNNGGLLKEINSRSNCNSIEPYLTKLRAVGYKDEELIKYIASYTTIRGEVKFEDGTSEWADSKKEGDMKNKAMIAIPIVALTTTFALGLTSPLTVIPAFMLVRNTAAFAFRETPGRLLSPLVGLIKQKDTLAFHDICIDDYYNTDELLE